MPEPIYSTHGGPVTSPAYVDDPSALAQSGVSWGAILAGAIGAAALSLILLLLGTGLGLSSVSPWSGRGASAATFGVATILWITFTQIAASGMGGYLAGRLRTRWAGVHSDEVYFRDTAHGFLAWGVASLVTAALLTSTIGSILGSGAQAGAAALGGATTAAAGGLAAAGPSDATDSDASSSGPMTYYVDALFRKDAPAAAAPPAGAAPIAEPPRAADTDAARAAQGAEVGRIFANAIRAGGLPPEDARHAAALVAQRTGMSQADAEKRVNDVYARTQKKLDELQASAKAAADKARKASAYASLWLFISLLIGAFAASLAATYGGRQRDL